MKLISLLLAVIIPTAAFAKEDPKLTESDLAHFAVFEATTELQSDGGKDNFIIRWVDGKEVREVAQFRFEKDSTGKGVKIYTLVLPGEHDVTLRYFGVRKHSVLRTDYFDADFTQRCILKPGRYRVEGTRDDKFASFSLRRIDSGDFLIENVKAVIQKTDSPTGRTPIFIPIPVK